MSWLFIALASYFLSALAIIIDKFILGAKKIGSPPVYAFYIAVLSLGALIFLPFNFSVPSGFQILISFASGALFTFGILCLYYAIQKGEASRVAPLVGAIIPLVIFLVSITLLGEKINLPHAAGAIILVAGGLLISFDLPLKIHPRTFEIIKKCISCFSPICFVFNKTVQAGRKKFVPGFEYAVFSGALLALAYLLFKIVYSEQDFFNGFVWTRFGCALAVAFFFFVPPWRAKILVSLKHWRRPTGSHYRTGALVVLNKLIGGASSILFNYAIALGSVILVNALVSSQYVFILFLAVIFSRWHPKVFEEKLYFWDWAQKVAAIVLIGGGIYLVAKPAGVGMF